MASPPPRTAPAARTRAAAFRAASDLMRRYELATMAGMTFGDRRDVYAALGYKRVLTARDYRDRFRRGGIAQRIVTAYPDATWRGQGELVEDEDPDTVTAFEEQWESLATRLSVWTTLSRADVLSGLGRYSAVLIGVKDKTADMSTPLPKMRGPDDVIYLQPFSEDDAPVETLDEAMDSPRYGRPLLYSFKRISTVKATRRVHWSRVVHVADGLLDDDIYGTPRLEPVWNNLDDLEKVVGGGSEAFWLRAHQGYTVDVTDNPETEIDPEEMAAMRDNVEEFAHQMRRVVALRSAKLKALGSDVADFKGNADAILTVLSGTTGIPKRILVGSEMGELASTQDRSNWSERISDRREEFAGPLVVRQLVDRLIEHGALAQPEQYEVRWPTIDSLDEVEKAALTEKLATANQKNGEPVLTTDEIRDRVWKLEPLEEPLGADTTEPVAEPEEVDVAARSYADVDRPAGDAEWKAVHAAADRQRGKVRALMAEAFAGAFGRVPVAKLQAAVTDEDAGEASELLEGALAAALEAVQGPLADRLHEALQGGGAGAARAADRVAKGLSRPRAAGIGMAFDRTNPAARAWAEARAAELVTEVTGETRASIRAIIARAFSDQIPPREAARLLRKVVGLTSRQAWAVIEVRFQLQEAAPGALVRAGAVKVRVPRDGASPSFIARVAAAYSDRLIRQRALLIARTETMRASNEGQRQLWLQARQAGLLTGTERREWIVTPDDRLCERCEAMEGQLRGLDEPFEDPLTGEQALAPPLHPNCRCAMGLAAAETAERAVA